jgi:hypothetical protein
MSRDVHSVIVTCSTLEVMISSIISVAVTGLVVVKDSMIVTSFSIVVVVVAVAVVDVVVVELSVT